MINNEIKSTMVNLVTEGSKGLQLITLEEAIKIAEQTNEDVVCVNSNTEIPVVKIINYNKFLYEKNKKEKENRKKSRLNTLGTKEITLSEAIAEHDLIIKAKNIDRLLKEGNKVKISITYKGRSIRLIGQGNEKINTLISHLKYDYKVESGPNIVENKVVICIVSNKKK